MLLNLAVWRSSEIPAHHSRQEHRLSQINAQYFGFNFFIFEQYLTIYHSSRNTRTQAETSVDSCCGNNQRFDSKRFESYPGY
jgi:hypothetical protein